MHREPGIDTVIVHKTQGERDLPSINLRQVGKSGIEETVVKVEVMVFSRYANRDELRQRAARVPRLKKTAYPFGRRHHHPQIGQNGHLDLFSWTFVDALETQCMYRRVTGEEVS